MNSYTGLHAEYFDLIYAEKPYDAESEALQTLFARNNVPPGGRVLELACGTGTHAIALAKRGYAITAVDICPDLIGVAKAKNSKTEWAIGEIQPEFICEDIRYFDYPTERYDAATCLFDSVGYLGEDRVIVEFLSQVHRSLKPGGTFVLEFLQRDRFVAQFDPLRVREWSLPDGGTLLRISNVALDQMTSTFSVRYRMIELASTGSWRMSEETQENRYFTLEDMQRLFASAGFMSTECMGAYDLNAPSQSHWHLLAVARKE
jgi:SAM-dependent methyltransferase